MKRWAWVGLVVLVGCIPPKPSAQMAQQIGCSQENTAVDMRDGGAYASCISPSSPSYFCTPNSAGTWACEAREKPREDAQKTSEGLEHAKSGKVTAIYDEFKKVTVIRLKGMEVTGELEIDMIAVTPSVNKRVGLTIHSSSENWQYLKCHGLDWLLDDQPFSVPTNHDGSVGSGYVVEHVSAFVSYEDIERMGASKIVKGRLCSDVFLLDSEQIQRIREFIELVRAKEEGPPNISVE